LRAVLTSPPVTEHERTGFRRRLLLLTVLALAVRLTAFLLEPEVAPVADERTWVDWARIVAEKAHFSPFAHKMIFHPPLYPYFLAALYALAGTFTAAKLAQVVLAALLVPAVGLLGARAFGPAAGALAAAFTAFYPELVWFSFHFWVENLFLVLLYWGFERLVAAEQDGRAGPALAGGVLWGLAILTRETALYFLPVAAAFLALSRRRRGAPFRAAVFAGAALLTVAPWTWRNWVEFRALVPVSTAGGQNLFQGNTHLPRDETYRLVDAVQGRIEQYHFARRMGLEAIKARQPWWIFEKLREQMPMFWEAHSMAIIHVQRKAYGEVGAPGALALAVVMLAPYLAALALLVLGLAALDPTPVRLLLLSFLAYYNLIHVVTHGFNRYRLPVMPIVFLLGAAALSAWREGRLELTPRRRALAAALGLGFALLVAPSLRRHAAHEAFGLQHPAAAAEPGP
jgi:4-amino-4-deoxy-L-arabinose transferase-like glycosyltransferase